MVVAENADFMEAKLEGGKTHYVLLKPRPGLWKARFSLIPIRKDPSAQFSQSLPDFGEWQTKAKWVRRGAGADAWYEEHAADVAAKKNDYLKKWDAMLEVDKRNLRLLPEDGV